MKKIRMIRIIVVDIDVVMIIMQDYEPAYPAI